MGRSVRDPALDNELWLRVLRHNEAHPNAKTKLGDLTKIHDKHRRSGSPAARGMAAVDAHLETLAQSTGPASPELPCIGLPLSRLPAYEAGAVLFSYLAYPEPGVGDDAQRADARAALCNRALHAIGNEDENWRWSVQSLAPAYLLMSDREVARVLRRFDRLIEDRLTAARMAIPFLQEAETGAPAKVPERSTPGSIAQMAEFVLPGTTENDPVNVRSRIWSPSLPVLHIAVATEIAFSLALKANVPKLAATDLVRSPDLIRFVVSEAEKYEVLLTLAPKLELALERLVRFRLT